MRRADLERLFAAYGLGEAFAEQEALFLWTEVVGPNVSRLTRPQRVSEGVLYVQVGNATIAHEYSQMREAWLQRLNQTLQRPLADIRFKVAALAGSALGIIPGMMPKVDEVALDAPERDRVHAVLNGMEESELKQALARLFETYQKAEKIKATEPNQRQCPGCGLYHDGPEPLCAFCRLEGREPVPPE